MRRQKLNTLEVCLFLRQFATLITAGVPLLRCCETLEKTTLKIHMRILINRIRNDIVAGNSLASAFSKHKEIFDPLTCHLTRIGEHTGKLDLMLTMIAERHEKNFALKKRVIQALIYPIIISLTALLITLGLFLFVIPKFSELFQEQREQLPFFTLVIFWISAKLKAWLIYCILISVTVGMILFYLFANTKVKNNCKEYLCKLPFIQFYYHKMILTQFSRNLAICLSAGIQIVEALNLVTHSLNGQFAIWMRQLRNRVNTGLHLHEALASNSHFPHLLVQMVQIGEESGKLESMLSRAADFMEFETEQLIGRLSQILEPLIMLLLGVLIGGLVIGLYLPIFKLGSAF